MSAITADIVGLRGAPNAAEAAPSTVCAHCGLPVPAGLVDHAKAEQFCCHACETARAVIRGCGLDAYYRLRAESAEAAGVPARSTSKRYAEFDDAVFRSLHAKPMGGGRWTIELFLEGVHCAACVWLVERLPAVCPGVIEARLDLRRSLVRVIWDEAATSVSAAARALDALGYPPHPARGVAAREAQRRSDRRTLIRLAVAWACAGNVMLLALALYAGMFDWMEHQYVSLFRWVSMGISVVSLAWPGSVFFRGAWAAIRTRTPHLDLPIALGLGAGGIWGIVNTVRGVGEIYFDSLAVLVLALLVGRWIQGQQTRWAADAVELLFSLTPTSARLVEQGPGIGETVRDVPIEAVQAGQVVEVRAGDSVPVDGRIVRGESTVDRALLTGESRPVSVGVGSEVSAGAVNLSGVLRVCVAAAGEATRAGRLMKMVEEGTRRRAPIVRLADSISVWFMGAMIGLSLVTLAVWLWLAPEQAVDNATALLIVTCPCALGLATPLAVTVAIGRAARRNILIKGGDALERFAKPGLILLDKTGTITQGRLSLVKWIGDERVKPLVAAIEAVSSHPIALALVRDLGAAAPGGASDVEQTIGGGIRGTVGMRRVVVGSPSYVAGLADGLPGWAALARDTLANEALTPVLVAADGVVVAVAGLGDPIRPDAKQAIDSLRAAGWEIGVLSGDHSDVAAAVGRALDLDPGMVRGGMLPEDKLAAVHAAKAANTARPVVMVGDGVNDAAALAAATLGIAVHGGAEASLAAADVYISTPGLAPIADLASASRRTMAVIRRNLGASLFYNAAAAALAVAGIINPLIAALLMPASSLTVVALSVRASTFGGGRCR